MKKLVVLGMALWPILVACAEDQLPTPIVLPQRVYGLEGTPCVIRFDTLVYAPVKHSVLFDVQDGPGAQYNDQLLWHPKEKDSGKPVQIGVYSGSSFDKLGEAASSFIFCNPKALKNRGPLRWLAIGDSLTLPGHYIRQTLDLLAREAPEVRLEIVGTQHPKDDDTVRHEGRGGWSWIRYLEAFPPKFPAKSPFVFGPRGREDFDFGRYVREELNGKPPEVITVFLGANDVYGISADFAPEKVNAIIENAQTMVAKIREAAPRSVIGIIPPPPPSEQNGFGVNYSNGVTEWQYRRAMQHYIAGLLKAFDGRWDESIYIVPGYLKFDPATAYPMASNRAQNALHPVAAGFQPISNALGSWFVYLLSADPILSH